MLTIKKINEQIGHPISNLCSFLEITRWGYYKSLKKEIKKELLQEIVLQLVIEKRKLMPRLGGKKLYWMLKPDIMELDESIGRDKFFDILRNNKLLVSRKKNFARTTDSYHRFHKHKNLIKSIVINRSNQVYASDITYLRLDKGRFVYLFLITDMFSRKIVGWHLSNSLGIEGAMIALKMALKQCPDTTGLIHHSDRGIQYCSKDYTKLLCKNNVGISMTEENHCYENSLAERVNGILKDEFYLDVVFGSHMAAFKAVKQAINIYNEIRPHLSLNYATPEEIHKSAA